MRRRTRPGPVLYVWSCMVVDFGGNLLPEGRCGGLTTKVSQRCIDLRIDSQHDMNDVQAWMKVDLQDCRRKAAFPFDDVDG